MNLNNSKLEDEMKQWWIIYITYISIAIISAIVFIPDLAQGWSWHTKACIFTGSVTGFLFGCLIFPCSSYKLLSTILIGIAIGPFLGLVLLAASASENSLTPVLHGVVSYILFYYTISFFLYLIYKTKKTRYPTAVNASTS